MATTNNTTVRPFVEIHAEETKAGDNAIFDFLSNCLGQSNNALPNVNEQKQGIYSGLIHEFDQYTTLRLKPGGADRVGLENLFKELASDNGCNIILWIGENSYCTIGGVHEASFRKTIADILKKDGAKNTLKTVVILISCNRDASAKTLNAERRENRYIVENPTHYSQKPVFLGFNGQVHSYKSDLYVCHHFIDDEDFPSRLCINPKTTRNDTNSSRLQEIKFNGSSNEEKLRVFNEIFQRPDSRASERLKCCQTMIKDYPRHFIEEFKGKRDCIKVTKAKLDLRIKNILSKYDSNEINDTTAKDSTIRAHDPSGEFDGISCKPTGDDENPCRIINNIIDRDTINRANEYIRSIPEQKKIWGKFLYSLDNKDLDTVRSGFTDIFNRLTEDQKREYVDIKNKNGHTALFYILSNGRISNDKMEFINILLTYGASLTVYTTSDRGLEFGDSIGTALFEKDSKNGNIMKQFLLNTNFNVLTDAVLQERRRKLPLATENFARRKFSEADNTFKNFMNNWLKGYINRFRSDAEKLERAKEVFRIVGTRYNVDFTATINNTDRTVENDYRILEVLRSQEDGTTVYNKIENAIKNITERGTQNIFTSAAVTGANASAATRAGAGNGPTMGGRRKRKNKTKKNRRNHKKATRKH
jgi:hypothetical protein